MRHQPFVEPNIPLIRLSKALFRVCRQNRLFILKALIASHQGRISPTVLSSEKSNAGPEMFQSSDKQIVLLDSLARLLKLRTAGFRICTAAYHADLVVAKLIRETTLYKTGYVATVPLNRRPKPTDIAIPICKEPVG